MGSKRGAQVRRVDSSGGGSRRTYIIIGLIAAVFIAGFAALVILDAREKSMSTAPDTVKSYDVGPAGNHTEADVDYEQNPPVGGAHNPVWQNCGYYAQPVRNENAVHSLEHGAVWITYQPNLPKAQVDVLANMARSQQFVLVSPYPGLPAPVVASGWGVQEWFHSSGDAGLTQFVSKYRQGPQTPEPGAPCSNGTGTPQ